MSQKVENVHNFLNPARYHPFYDAGVGGSSFDGSGGVGSCGFDNNEVR